METNDLKNLGHFCMYTNKNEIIDFTFFLYRVHEIKIKTEEVKDGEDIVITNSESLPLAFGDDSKMHPCPKCEKSFKNSGTLNWHIKNVHVGIRNHHCEECSKAFLSNADKQRHILSVHKGIKPFKCTECDKGFTQRNHMIRYVFT